MAEAVEATLYTLLSGTTAITDLVGGAAAPRIYNVKKDGDKPAAFPFLTFERVGIVEPHHAMGLATNFFQQAQYRFHAWAETTSTASGGDTAAAITQEVREALHGYSSGAIDCAICDDYRAVEVVEPSVHHWVSDFIIAHNADTG